MRVDILDKPGKFASEPSSTEEPRGAAELVRISVKTDSHGPGMVVGKGFPDSSGDTRIPKAQRLDGRIKVGRVITVSSESLRAARTCGP